MVCKKNSYRILVFDNHQEILDLLKMVFSSRGYEVLAYLHPGDCSVFDLESCMNPQRLLTDFKNLYH